MSETDSFINEVTEEVRRDQLYGYLRRYAWIAVVVVLGAVGYTAWNEYSKATTAAAAQAKGDAVLSALEAGDAAAQAEALSQVDAGEAAQIVALRRAGALVEAGDTAAAVTLYNEVATSADPVYAELAILKAVILQGQAMAPADRLAALEPLSTPGAPYRPLALEQMAIAEMDAGDNDAAIARLTDLIQDSEATDNQRSRVGQLLVALGGQLPDLTELLSGG
ncbi:MAG: tetratricopeptide repeat protein [Pseudomonadota bacterium]